MRRVVICAAVCAFAPAALAQQADSPLKSAMKLFGFATDSPAPADFVVKSRPARDVDFIPVFQPPPEPAKPAMKDKDLNALRGDLDSVQKQHDALRAAYPPSAKAAAEQAAGKRPKAETPGNH
jgi:hypothetical protein